MSEIYYRNKHTGELVEAQTIEEGIYVGHYRVAGARWQCVIGPDLFSRIYTREEEVPSVQGG